MGPLDHQVVARIPTHSPAWRDDGRGVVLLDNDRPRPPRRIDVATLDDGRLQHPVIWSEERAAAPFRRCRCDGRSAKNRLRRYATLDAYVHNLYRVIFGA